MALAESDTSVNKLVFLTTRADNKESATLVSSGPHGHIHFWNVFNGGFLMAYFSAVGITLAADSCVTTMGMLERSLPEIDSCPFSGFMQNTSSDVPHVHHRLSIFWSVQCPLCETTL